MIDSPEFQAGDEVRLRALRWRCRRGMRELDVLLTRWLEGEFPSASPGLQQQFVRLLEQEDDQLWDWLLGRSEPQDVDLQQIVAMIRQCPPAVEPDEGH